MTEADYPHALITIMDGQQIKYRLPLSVLNAANRNNKEGPVLELVRHVGAMGGLLHEGSWYPVRAIIRYQVIEVPV